MRAPTLGVLLRTWIRKGSCGKHTTKAAAIQGPLVSVLCLRRGPHTALHIPAHQPQGVIRAHGLPEAVLLQFQGLHEGELDTLMDAALDEGDAGRRAAAGALDGVRVLAPETVARATAVQVDGERDRSLGVPMRWALGFHLGGHRLDLFGYDTSPRTFGHGGHGSSVGWADPDMGLGVAILTSGLRGARGHALRMATLSDAIRKACR